MNVWIQDADQVDFGDFSLSNVYRTRCVDNFLYGEKIYGIVASRGIGKTFLLKARRMIEQEKSGVECLPEDAMLATLTKPSIDSSAKNYLQNYDNWVAIWESAIFVTVISRLYKKGVFDLDLLNNALLHKMLVTHHSAIEDVFCTICSQSKSYLNTLKGEYAECRSAIREAHNGISIFIDRLDQAFSPDIYKTEGQTESNSGPSDPVYWKYVQVALAQASYRISAINSHIKVFFSIRKEALLGAEYISREYVNFYGSIQEIVYSKHDLLNMFHSYIGREVDENLLYPDEKYTNPEKAFLGVDKIRHQYVKQVEENPFNYIYRHTFGRPRDLMHICSNLYPKLYKEKIEDIEKVIRHGVNQGSLFLLENYIIELEPFIYQLTRSNLNFLCEKLISNVLNISLMRSACFDYNQEFEILNPPRCGNCLQGKSCVDCQCIHPFCQLYNVGLLGEFHELKGFGFEIRFKQYDSFTNAHFHSLPNSKLYCLHPALANKVEEIRAQSNHIYDHANAIIGHGESFDSKKVSSLNKRLSNLRNKFPEKRVFISSTCYDLGDTRKAIKKALYDKGYDVFLSDDDTFNTDTAGFHTHDHCINELLKCDYMIFIVSGRYGGEYQGSQYAPEAKQIGNLNSALKNPSISLMEFFVAKEKNIPMSVFIDEKVNDERNIYNRQPNKKMYRLTRVNDSRVFDIITFITNQVNVWRQEYRNEEHLLNLINIALPR